jgi:hypothetical protein
LALETLDAGCMVKDLLVLFIRVQSAFERLLLLLKGDDLLGQLLVCGTDFFVFLFDFFNLFFGFFRIFF